MIFDIFWFLLPLIFYDFWFLFLFIDLLPTVNHLAYYDIYVFLVYLTCLMFSVVWFYFDNMIFNLSRFIFKLWCFYLYDFIWIIWYISEINLFTKHDIYINLIYCFYLILLSLRFILVLWYFQYDDFTFIKWYLSVIGLFVLHDIFAQMNYSFGNDIFPTVNHFVSMIFMRFWFIIKEWCLYFFNFTSVIWYIYFDGLFVNLFCRYDISRFLILL